MATQIKLRRDTYQNWYDSNPVLGLAEPGFDTTNKKLKIGDGSTAWRSLNYFDDQQTDLTTVAQDIIPDADNTRNIGSPDRRWQHGYFASGSLYVGDIKLSNDNGRLLVQQVTDAGLISETPVPDAPGSVTTNKLINGSLEVVLDVNGTLTVPSPQSGTFLLTFDSSSYVTTVGKPTLTLTDTAWAITGGIVYEPNGSRSLVLESFVPSPTNPGYDTGDEFTFDSTVHGIPGYTLSLILNSVGELVGQGWTSDISASQLPDYPATVKSNGAVKITADVKNWAFGTDGVLTLPAGGDIVDSTGTSVLGGGTANTGDIAFSGNILYNGVSTDQGIQIAPGGESVSYIQVPGNAESATTAVRIGNASPTGSVEISVNGYTTYFQPDGSIEHGSSFTRATAPVVSIGAGTVVWTGLFDYISSAKLIIQVECSETGDATGWHVQTCEAIIASRGYGNGISGYGDPVMTVYGIVHTSTVPLVTFTVRRNPTTRQIEVVGTLTAAAGGDADLRIHSVEMSTRD